VMSRAGCTALTARESMNCVPRRRSLPANHSSLLQRFPSLTTSYRCTKTCGCSLKGAVKNSVDGSPTPILQHLANRLRGMAFACQRASAAWVSGAQLGLGFTSSCSVLF
jgi:hypothetical protein